MTATLVRDHYQAAIDDRSALLARLNTIVDGLDGPVTAAKLARLDQFHFGGLAATAELAKRAGVSGTMHVLDAGSGLGGPSRYLAETFGCHVEGVDLAPDYVAVSALLTERAGLSETVSAQVGDLTALPFEDARFDLVWSQHVVMNIRDRDRLYRELRRVLKQGGAFAFFDPIAADGSAPLLYPVPWATSADTSTLLTEAETLSTLRGAGFRVAALDDVTQQALGWAPPQPTGPPSGPNPGVIVGARMGEMVANFVSNLREGRVRLVMAVCEAV